MSSPFVPSSFSYGDLPQGGALAPIVVSARAPSNTIDKQYQAGYFWLSSLDQYIVGPGGVVTYGNGNLYYQAGNSAGTPNWVLVSDSSGPIVGINGTANQITATNVAGTVTLSIPAAFIAPGSIASTTTMAAGTALSAGTTITAGTGITSTLGNIVASAGNISATLGSVSAGTTVTAGTGITATTGNIVASTGDIISTLGAVAAATTVTGGTGVTATTGNVTATAGNFVSSLAGNGLLFNANTATGAAPGPVVLNSRAGQVIFTGVSIAAAADLTLTITNSAITGATTQVIYSMSGSTTGSAPSIKSVTNSAGSSDIVVTNGTGATTTIADITLNFIVVN